MLLPLFTGEIQKVYRTMIIVMNDRKVKQQFFMFYRQKKIRGSSHRKVYSNFFFFVTFFSSPKAAALELSQVKLREIFPLLSCGNNRGEAQESVDQPLAPQLLNSYQGHKKSITAILYFEKSQVLISSSRDKSVRLWNLSGQVKIS